MTPVRKILHGVSGKQCEVCVRGVTFPRNQAGKVGERMVGMMLLVKCLR